AGGVDVPVSGFERRDDDVGGDLVLDLPDPVAELRDRTAVTELDAGRGDHGAPCSTGRGGPRRLSDSSRLVLSHRRDQPDHRRAVSTCRYPASNAVTTTSAATSSSTCQTP